MDSAIKAIVEKLEDVKDLSPEYCQKCMTAEYAPFDQLKDDFDCTELYENGDLEVYLLKAAQKVRSYCTVNPDTSRFFETLRSEGMDISKLTTFLWFCIDSGLQADRNKRALKRAIAASSLYMILCSIKSAKLYRLFEVNLFQKCIELFKNTEKTLRPLASKIANISQAKKRGAAEPERNDPLEIGDEIKSFVEYLKDAMRSFYVVLYSHSVADVLLENDERCPMLVDFLRDVAYFDISSSTNYNKRLIDSVSSMEKISELSFAIAHEVLAKSSELRALTVASRFVMPYLLFWICGSAKQALSGSLPQVLKDARTVMVRFLSVRVDCMTRVEMECYMKVLKTIPFKCFDRAEYRSNVAETFVDILTIVPPMAYFILDDIYVLGCHQKTQNRSFAYEIVNHLLRKFPFDSLPDPPIPYSALIMDENTVVNMDVVEEAEEIMEEELPPEEPEEVADQEVAENTEASEANGTNENGDAGTTELTEEEAAIPPPPFRQRAAANRSPDDLEFVRRGMNAKEAMMMLIVNGLIDKFAKQKALQTVESLFKNDSCVVELCKMATKFVNENNESLNLIDRAPIVKEEPMDVTMQADSNSMETDTQSNDVQQQPVYYADDLLYLILKGFENDKTVICKHALSTCVSVLLRSTVCDRRLFERCVEEIRLKTWDVAIQVRKQAAVCLRDLLQDSIIGSLPIVEKAWLSGLLHQVVDNEQTVAQQATKFVTEHIVNGLLKPRPNRAWELMETVEQDAEYTRYLAICFTEHSSNSGASQRTGNIQSLIQQLVRSLVRITSEDDCPPSAWMLLSELSHSLSVDPTCAEKAWDRLQLSRSDDRIPIYIAKILAHRCDSLKPQVRTSLKNKIGQQILENRIAVPHIAAICYAFACLANGILPNGGKANKEGVKELKKFIQNYNNKVVNILNSNLFVKIRREVASRAGTVTPNLASQASATTNTLPDPAELTPEFLMRSVYTVGELIQYASGKIDSHLFNLLRGIVATNRIDIDIQAASQLSDSQVSQTVPRSVRAAAVLALGKMSVVDESIATNTVPVFVRQLRQDPDHCVRNIILIAMADICTIGTAAVNTYGDILASCMRDPSVLIRKHAVFLVTTLIRDEYFKWKGQIMYFFLGALLDPDSSVREQVHASLLNVLLPKFPLMLSNHFVQAMFYLNDVVHPSMAVTIKQEEDECPLARDDRFTLFGHTRMEDRMKIYKFMISTFDDTKNLPLMGQIAQQVIESVAEDILDISNQNVVCLLLDAFKVIRSKEIILKMQTGKRAGGIDEIEEEHEEAQHMHAAATDTIINVYLRVIYQEVLLRLFKLRDYLKAKADPTCIELAKNCHSVYLDICENYYDHFETLMQSDPQRRDEIKNDLRRIRNRR